MGMVLLPRGVLLLVLLLHFIADGTSATGSEAGDASTLPPPSGCRGALGQAGQDEQVDGGGQRFGEERDERREDKLWHVPCQEAGEGPCDFLNHLKNFKDEVVARIEERIAAWTLLPPENGESMQILRYEHGEKYEPHLDYFRVKEHSARGGNQMATVLMYLSNVKMGGETVFPDLEAKLTQHKDETWSNCAEGGFAVKPVKGNAVLFFSLHLNTTVDERSLHGSCPVIEGEKWSATKWIHVRSFDNRRRFAVKCEDEDGLYPMWAVAGECAKNPGFMIGSKHYPGFCQKSCNVCIL
ncbi:hypothetical protein ABZP36_018070 [Zizania latifolia]